MYLYTAHRAKSTFHMAEATLTLKKQPTEQAYISFWPGLLMHNSESKATTLYTGQTWPFLHSNTTQRAKRTYHTGKATLTLKHNSDIAILTQLTDPSMHFILATPTLRAKHTQLSKQSIHSILATHGHSYTQEELTERGVHSRITTTAIFTQHILPTEGTFHTAKNHSCTLIHNTHSKAFLYTSIYVNSFTSIIAH